MIRSGRKAGHKRFQTKLLAKTNAQRIHLSLLFLLLGLSLLLGYTDILIGGGDLIVWFSS